MTTLLSSPLRRALASGIFVVLAGCSATGGGCSPIDDGSPTTTTDPTTTTIDDGSTTTVAGEGSTTTTVDGTTTTVDGGSTTTTPSGPTTTVPGEVTLIDVEDLEPGTCVTPPADTEALRQVELADCSSSHLVEAFAVFDLDTDDLPGGETFPGGSELRRLAYERCQGPFEDYVGITFWDSIFDITTITPAPSTWAEGDRQIVCLVADVDGAPLTDTARDARR